MQSISARLLSVQSGSLQGLKNSTKKLDKRRCSAKKGPLVSPSRAWIPTSNGLLDGNRSKRSSRKQSFDCYQGSPFL